MSEGYYGRNGVLGLATPQANPTAETEFRALMPQGVACATVRMVSAELDPAARLRAYFTDIAQTLNRFDSLSLQSIGLACTGSTYLLGHEAVEAHLGKLSSKRGQPVISAAAAIERALAHLGVNSIALICPYPEWLLTAAERHWRARGCDVVDQFSLDPNQGDTRAIYALSPEAAGDRIEARWRNTESRRLPHYGDRAADFAHRLPTLGKPFWSGVVFQLVSGLGFAARSGHRPGRESADVVLATVGRLGTPY